VNTKTQQKEVLVLSIYIYFKDTLTHQRKKTLNIWCQLWNTETNPDPKKTCNKL